MIAFGKRLKSRRPKTTEINYGLAMIYDFVF